jgi:pSer/pThr/pTyr-binding forkhead associated (FHA) protein
MSIHPSTAATSLAQLVPEEPAGDNDAIPLCQFPVVIGRSEEAQFSFDDRWLSRQHCEIDCFDGKLVIRDLGSRHGTYVNDMQIDESPLNMDDQLRIGLTRFIVKPAI